MTTPKLQQHWPEWEIIRPLGEGAFGKVYEISRGEGDLEEYAALKVIHIPQSESEVKCLRSEGADEASISTHFKELAGQLSNEIATQAKLKGNSNIVSYEDRKIVPDENGLGCTILIRMELLTSLLDHMTASPMSQDDVLQLGLDMARALLLCEKHHIVHRDIKPQNIFISPNGDYKLGDFGVARQLEQTTNNLSRKGTYNYMAPEVFHGRASNVTVDIYSLGIVLYTLLNGNRAPFLQPPPAPFPSAKERESAQHKRLSGEVLPPLQGVPPVLNELVLKMCAYAPKDRFQNARELAEAMEGAVYELRADKTVSLFSWIGSNTPDVARTDAIAEDEGSRWMDGTPVTVDPLPPASEPEPMPPASEPEPEFVPVKRSNIKIIVALVATLVVVVCVAVGLGTMLLRGQQDAVEVASGLTTEETSTEIRKTSEETTSPPSMSTPSETETENIPANTPPTTTTSHTTTVGNPTTMKMPTTVTATSSQKMRYNGFVYELTDPDMRILSSIAITGYEGSGGNVIIPSQIGINYVDIIDSEAFMNNTTINTVTIPYTVSSIGERAFYGCQNLYAAYFEGLVPQMKDSSRKGLDAPNVFGNVSSSFTIYYRSENDSTNRPQALIWPETYWDTHDLKGYRVATY